MKKITKPKIKARDVVKDSVDNMQNLKLKQDILNNLHVFDKAEIEFNSKKQNNTLYSIIQKETISNLVDASELKKLYTSRMLKKENLARKYYDSIFLSAANGKCPFCSQRIVKTLDHYLPKSEYPIYSVVPINLVPSCADCNKDKLADIPKCSKDETLHPYYDDVEGEIWLSSKIVTINPDLEIEFYVSPPKKWSKLLYDRAKNHLIAYKLNELYSIHAVEEFHNIKQQLVRLFQKGGSVLLKEHLEDCYESRLSYDKNSWQTAFYRGLINDTDFINGMFIAQNSIQQCV